MDILLAIYALRRDAEIPHPFQGGPGALLTTQTNSLLLSTSPFGARIHL